MNTHRDTLASTLEYWVDTLFPSGIVNVPTACVAQDERIHFWGGHGQLIVMLSANEHHPGVSNEPALFKSQGPVTPRHIQCLQWLCGDETLQLKNEHLADPMTLADHAVQWQYLAQRVTQCITAWRISQVGPGVHLQAIWDDPPFLGLDLAAIAPAMRKQP